MGVKTAPAGARDARDAFTTLTSKWNRDSSIAQIPFAFASVLFTTPAHTLATLAGRVYPERLTMSLFSQNLSISQRDELRAAATAVAANSYSPYSHFRVGAALLLSDGSIITGCNVENCSYRLTSCAEQAAIARAVSEQGPGVRLRAVAVANLNDAASMPCGACRQTLSEFGDDDTLILYPGAGSVPLETTLGALLPQAFRPEFLEPK